MVKTIRLIAPDWQGGNKHAYYFGAELLSWLAPKNDNQKEIKLDIEQTKNEELEKENGVVAQSSVNSNVSMAAEVMAKEFNDKFIIYEEVCIYFMTYFYL